MPKRVRAEPREQCHAGSGGEDDPAAAADDRGHRATTQAFLDRAELTTLVERVLSIDEARAWKPSRAPYQLALRAVGVPAERVTLVAGSCRPLLGHPRRARRRSGHRLVAARLEGQPTPAFTPADVSAPTLDAVIASLMALPAPDA